MRVQGVYDYAEWLLQGTPDADGGAWDKAALLAKVKDGERDDIKLVQPVPVIWVYLTGWANDDGAANFRNDVYGIDNPRRGERQRRRRTRRAAAPSRRSPPSQ